ncbi:hypothetical protein [Halpernia sp. GG3]
MKKALVILFFLILIFVFYKIVTFQLFDDSLKVVKIFNIPNKKYKIKIYHIPSNATTQENIEIRKAENDEEFTLKNFEMYNVVENAKIKGDSLFLKIKDSTGGMPLKNVKILLPKY